MTKSNVKKMTNDRNKESKLAAPLSDVLCDLFATRLKSQVYHWNFEGGRFFGVHKTLEEVYESFDDFIDDLAERIRTIGGRPISSYEEITERSKVHNSSKDKTLDPEEMIEDMSSSLDELNAGLKKAIGKATEADDPVTEDMLIGILSKSEKFKWMIHSIQTASS